MTWLSWRTWRRPGCTTRPCSRSWRPGPTARASSRPATRCSGCGGSGRGGRRRTWSLQFVVVADGAVIGTQEVGATRFATLREVSTGSWLGRTHHGNGYGTEMRAAVLDLAFDGLGAEYATSEAFEDNAASYRVSRKLGYVDDGIARHVVRDKPVVGRRLRLDRAGWAASRRVPVKVVGLAPCLPMFGLAGD